MQRSLRFLNYAVLIAVTLGAVGVMWWLSSRNNGPNRAKQVVSELPETIRPKPRVDVRHVEPEDCPIFAVCTGKIRPWETYRVGFEIAGRIAALSEEVGQQQLDEGDRVRAGQIIARLDDRILRALYDEASAQRELATTEMNRARKLREGGSRAITDTEYQKRLTDLALAEARFTVAEKNLEDSVLRAPVNATIAKRQYKVGESVNPHQAVFELVQDDPILLVVDVPESKVSGLQKRMAEVTAAGANAGQAGAAPARFRAIVQLHGTDPFGQPWRTLEGSVHQIAVLASLDTGMIEVEIALPNPDQRLRAGMVATAWIETDRIFGYRLPENALVVRRGQSHFYTVEPESAEIQALYWDVGKTTFYRAARRPVDRLIEQRPLPNHSETKSDRQRSQQISNLPEIIVPTDSSEDLLVVVRGQHRLTDRQLVRVVGGAAPAAAHYPSGIDREQRAETRELKARGSRL